MSIIELTANKVYGKEVSKVKCLDSVDVPDEVRYVKSKVRPLRNRLVHNCIDFSGLKEVFDVKESASKDFTILLKVYADVIGYSISYEELFEHVDYIVSFVNFIEDMIEKMSDME